LPAFEVPSGELLDARKRPDGGQSLRLLTKWVLVGAGIVAVLSGTAWVWASRSYSSLVVRRGTPVQDLSPYGDELLNLEPYGESPSDLDPRRGVPAYSGPGWYARRSPDGLRVAVTTSWGGFIEETILGLILDRPLFHTVGVWDEAAHRLTPVVSIKEADPHSGIAHRYAWSQDAQALLIHGSGRLPEDYELTVDLCLVYLPKTDQLYRISNCPPLWQRGSGSAGTATAPPPVPETPPVPQPLLAGWEQVDLGGYHGPEGAFHDAVSGALLRYYLGPSPGSVGVDWGISLDMDGAVPCLEFPVKVPAADCRVLVRAQAPGALPAHVRVAVKGLDPYQQGRYWADVESPEELSRVKALLASSPPLWTRPAPKRHPRWDPRDEDMKKAAPGMSLDEVIRTTGMPTSISKTTGGGLEVLFIVWNHRSKEVTLRFDRERRLLK
jgi:hypothetical protein